MVEREEIGKTEAETAEPSEPIPEGEVATEVGKKKKIGALWSPLEDQKVYAIVQKLKKALLTIPKSEVYRAEGKTPYCGFRVGPRRTFANVNLSPKRAVCRVGRMVGSKTFWNESFKITEDGITKEGNTIEIAEILELAKEFIKDKEWA